MDTHHTRECRETDAYFVPGAVPPWMFSLAVVGAVVTIVVTLFTSI